ncbi:hypothetical protein EXIGLDRAFT_722988 [Exidia glandulosa HHB12029]|uniref:DUF6533 domain-containing protein n=1 Tax=Exidia glandulosa HHB12029 TaxID=1314781 RepID=A0A165F110_EXIGL|nr:hypothetical protein EXIGLDRAFT_722988 [Exidia glandulosa HHB12029]
MDLSVILHAKYWEQFTRYEQVGFYALVMYDWLLSLSQESSLDLSPGFQPAKLAYLFARYWPLLTNPVVLWVHVVDHSPHECEMSFRLPLILQAGNFLGAAMVIAVRVHAFTGQKRPLAVLLTACLVTVTFYQIWVGASQIEVAPNGGCYPVDRISSVKHLSGYFLAPMLFDCIAVLIVLIYSLLVFPLRLMWDSSTITKIFIRDGALYFVAILAIHIFNAAMSFQPDAAISGTGVAVSMLLPSILACRLVLNLRQAGGKDADAEEASEKTLYSNLPSFHLVNGSTSSTQTLTGMRFPVSVSGVTTTSSFTSPV